MVRCSSESHAEAVGEMNCQCANTGPVNAGGGLRTESQLIRDAFMPEPQSISGGPK